MSSPRFRFDTEDSFVRYTDDAGNVCDAAFIFPGGASHPDFDDLAFGRASSASIDMVAALKSVVSAKRIVRPKGDQTRPPRPIHREPLVSGRLRQRMLAIIAKAEGK